ncbi:MAG: SMC family ATPase [Anaerolineae bacterium]|nr:SMC family ATPase [Anaerolineae bacterium]
MVPLKLELTNFLSYRDTAVLTFDHIHLACIAGANGAGKSSLLDGITWALFGRSRSKLDDDMVNKWAAANKQPAEVRFTFALENSVYRVTRRKPHGKTTTLDLDIQADETSWKTLTQSKIRETQAEIEKLLRMNYDTFINASFLLQGKADEFTTKTPNKRKEILAELLGLGEWDVYKEGATERRKQAEGQLALLDASLADIENELAEEETRQAALAAAQENHATIAARLADKQTLLDQLRRTEAAIAQQKKNIENLKSNLARAERALADLYKAQQRQQAERERYTAVLAQSETITAAYAAWQSADQEVQAWQDKANEYNRLQQARRPYELTIAQEKSRLEQRQRELQNQQTAVANAAAEKVEVAAQLAAAQVELTAVQDELTAVTAQEEQWQALRAQLSQHEAERQSQQRELAQLQTRAAQIEKMRVEQTTVAQNLAAAEKELTAVTAEIAALSETHQKHSLLLAEKNNLETDQPRLRDLFKQKRERFSQLEAQTGGDCPLCGQPLSADHRQTVLAELGNELQEMEAQGKANKERIETLAAEVAALDTRIKQSPKLEQQQQTQQDRKARAQARLEELAVSLAEWETTGAAQLTTLQTAVTDTTTLDTLKKEVAALETAVRQKATLDKKRQETERLMANQQARLAEIDRLTDQWQQAGQTELVQVAQRLAAGDFDAAAQQALAELDAQVTAVAYDPTAHTAVRAARDAQADAPEKQQQLTKAQAAVAPLEAALAELAAQITNQQQTVADFQQQVDTAVSELETLTADGADLRRVEDEVFRLREEENEANRQVGIAQNRLAVLADQRDRRTRLTADRVTQTEQIQRWKTLERAFGREGVQALLIEQAIPSIEEHANDLLERLTGGEMRVSFPTQRENKSNQVLRETLDIRIQDNAGERPYDNFSGGEQFRVNFAIRLALSQLLAKRAGARLQTLVIDEGFGSQDPLGRQRLIEAINTIQNDFQVILVITHIDELRDAFPTRIQVEKRPSGSVIEVV